MTPSSIPGAPTDRAQSVWIDGEGTDSVDINHELFVARPYRLYTKTGVVYDGYPHPVNDQSTRDPTRNLGIPPANGLSWCPCHVPLLVDQLTNWLANRYPQKRMTGSAGKQLVEPLLNTQLWARAYLHLQFGVFAQ